MAAPTAATVRSHSGSEIEGTRKLRGVRMQSQRERWHRRVAAKTIRPRFFLLLGEQDAGASRQEMNASWFNSNG
jgi:hypothetical protein